MKPLPFIHSLRPIVSLMRNGLPWLWVRAEIAYHYAGCRYGVGRLRRGDFFHPALPGLIVRERLLRP